MMRLSDALTRRAIGGVVAAGATGATAAGAGFERTRRESRRQCGDRAGRGTCGVNVLGGSVFFPNQHCGFFLCARIIGTMSAKPKTYQSRRFDFVALLHREPRFAVLV